MWSNKCAHEPVNAVNTVGHRGSALPEFCCCCVGKVERALGFVRSMEGSSTVLKSPPRIIFCEPSEWIGPALQSGIGTVCIRAPCGFVPCLPSEWIRADR